MIIIQVQSFLPKIMITAPEAIHLANEIKRLAKLIARKIVPVGKPKEKKAKKFEPKISPKERLKKSDVKIPEKKKKRKKRRRRAFMLAGKHSTYVLGESPINTKKSRKPEKKTAITIPKIILRKKSI